MFEKFLTKKNIVAVVVAVVIAVVTVLATKLLGTKASSGRPDLE